MIIQQFEKKQKLSQSNQLTIIEKSSQKKFFFGLNEALYLLDSINFKFSLTKFNSLKIYFLAIDGKFVFFGQYVFTCSDFNSLINNVLVQREQKFKIKLNNLKLILNFRNGDSDPVGTPTVSPATTPDEVATGTILYLFREAIFRYYLVYISISRLAPGVDTIKGSAKKFLGQLLISSLKRGVVFGSTIGLKTVISKIFKFSFIFYQVFFLYYLYSVK